jgi:hypothetical protein
MDDKDFVEKVAIAAGESGDQEVNMKESTDKQAHGDSERRSAFGVRRACWGTFPAIL